MQENVEFKSAFSIDKESPVPYYHQLKVYLLEEIEAGNWMPRQKLPSEAEFCEKLDISRTVVRQAIKDLQNKGYLATEKGRGTFIAKPKIIEGFVQGLFGFHEEMIRRGYKVATHILKQELTSAPPHVSEMLRIKVGTPVIMLSRLRRLNGEPSVYVTTYIPEETCPSLLHADLKNKSLYEFLQECKCGQGIQKGHRYIGVSLANEYEASLLEIEVGSPLIKLDSVTYLQDGSPLEYFHALHRGDRTKFEVELIRFTSENK
jgi:GntR family transcriptional regulator